MIETLLMLINTAQKMFNMKDKVSGYIINSDAKTDDLLKFKW